MLNLFQPIEFSLSKFGRLDPSYLNLKARIRQVGKDQSVPFKISPKSIFVNFGRKKNLKIGNCRKFDSKQFLYLELLVKISSYLSGNKRNFEKMSENHRKSVFFFCELVFYFSLLKDFLDRNQVYKVLGCLPCPFFSIFCSTLQENVIFCGWSEQKWIFSKFVPFSFPNQFFIFHFLKFFLNRKRVYKVLGGLPCPFFRFFALLCRKIHFFVSNIFHFC